MFVFTVNAFFIAGMGSAVSTASRTAKNILPTIGT